MTNLYLIRHGAYVSLEDGHFCDRGLTPEGRQQVERLRDRLAHTHEITAEVLITSTLPRARQTAELLAPVLGGLAIEPDDEVQEWRNTDDTITPETFTERLRATPSDQRAFFRPVSTGESWSEFMFRACTALNRITQKYAGKTVVLVAHGGIIEASFLFFSGLNILAPTPIFIDPAYTSITHWQKARGLTQDRWRLERYNDALHLAPWLTAKP